MAIQILKPGIETSYQQQLDARVRTTVEETLARIARQGDAAVRELSAAFDNYSPPSFRLSDQEIAELIAEVPEDQL